MRPAVKVRKPFATMQKLSIDVQIVQRRRAVEDSRGARDHAA
jgi:hypothetical protein